MFDKKNYSVNTVILPKNLRVLILKNNINIDKKSFPTSLKYIFIISKKSVKSVKSVESVKSDESIKKVNELLESLGDITSSIHDNKSEQKISNTIDNTVDNTVDNTNDYIQKIIETKDDEINFDEIDVNEIQRFIDIKQEQFDKETELQVKNKLMLEILKLDRKIILWRIHKKNLI